MQRLLLPLLALWLILPLSARASVVADHSSSPQTDALATMDAPDSIAVPVIGGDIAAARSVTPSRITRHSHYYGIGHNHLFDSYLSPLNYKGTTLVYTHQRENNAAWAGRKMTAMAVLATNVTLAKNPAGNGDFWDADLQYAYGLHRNWFLGQREQTRWRLALGALWGLHFGGTYSTRNGNNPVQARLGTDLAVSGLAEYGFPLWGKRWLWRSQLDVPLMGLMFTPRFGQSYYEIFSVEKKPRFVATYPGNAPSLRLLSTLTLPLRHQRLSVGCQVNIRQSHVHDLKRHAWNVAFVVGYTRTLKFLD